MKHKKRNTYIEDKQQECLITLNNGVEYRVTGKNPVGLWVWALNQGSARVLTFGNINVLSTEIASIVKL